jgi:acetyl esterase/lipase
LNQVLANQATHKANVNKILVGGTSAGANLVFLTTTGDKDIGNG